MQPLRQSTAVTVKLGPFLDATDGVSAETGLTIAKADVRLSKAGGNMAQKTDATACTHDELGVYDCALDATDTNTVGRLRIDVAAAGALPVWQEYTVLPAAVYDALVSGTDRLGVDLQEVSGDNTAADNLEAAYNGTGYAGGTVKPEVDVVSIGTDAITAASVANDAITEIQSGLATSANQTTILNRLGAWTGSAANTILGALRALATKAATLPTDIGGTYDPATDSLEAIRDTEPLGTATPTVEQIQSGLATAAAVEAVDTVVDGIAAKTVNLPASPAAVGSAMTLEAGAITAATIAADAIDADALSADLDSYGARVEIIDDDAEGADRYCVTWLQNMALLTEGVTAPKLRVIALADGTDLVAETGLTAVGSTGAYQYAETANRIVDGAAYMVLVTATIAAATRTWPHFIGRDSAAT